MALLLAVALVACHKEEQAVVGVAQTALTAEQKAQAAAQATAALRDRQRVALAAIPLPTKSMYVDVHDRGAWANPFLSVDADTLRHTMDFYADQMQDARGAISAFIQSPPETQHAA